MTGLTGFDPDLDDLESGVLSIRHEDRVLGEWAIGLADRTAQVPITPATRFGVASITKTFTALTVLSLVRDGRLALETTARSILGDDLPLIADDVTIDHLLTHTSGIGDYLDEDLDEEMPLSVPVDRLDSTPAYLPLLDGFPTKFSAGERFSYCNSGFVVLAIIAERVSATPFADLVGERVFAPAGMASSGFPRSDELPIGTATGYQDDGRTNIFQLPVVGSGDGGAHSTVADLHACWRALLGGSILPRELVALATETVTAEAELGMGYGRGMFVDDGDLVMLGVDYGVKALSRHDPATGVTVTALANVDIPVAGLVRDGLAAARASLG